MKLCQLVSGEIVVGFGTYEDCVACMEWLESEGANGAEMQIIEC